MNTMYDRISKNHYSDIPERDFAQPLQEDGLNGTMLFYIAVGVSGGIFMLFLMINAMASH